VVDVIHSQGVGHRTDWVESSHRAAALAKTSATLSLTALIQFHRNKPAFPVCKNMPALVVWRNNPAFVVWENELAFVVMLVSQT
jgi:hypothetical protein